MSTAPGRRAATCVGPRAFLRPPRARDRDEFLAAARASRRLHRARATPPATASQFAAYLRRIRGERSIGWLICRATDGRIAGVINLNEIVRGSFHSAYLGYYAFAESAGQGYMREGLRLVLRHAFATLRLHRLEANIQPDNAASIALVRRCGFRREGFSPRYLKIAGRWRDHERWAITKEEWRASN
ncbi:MAG TPA: GNAT family protein [Candidatus Kryptonia bacterium]|nr:GNAT family protein [Candidatus Kryptonia bacterium]